MRLLVASTAAALAALVGVAAIAAGPTTADRPAGVSAEAAAEIPADLLGVYRGAATLCGGLDWSVLAAVGWVESRHASGRADPATGEVTPPIVGPALDGSAGRARIPDPASSDGWAHAEGPMQFLSSTWDAWALLAPGRPDGATPSPDNAWDAIYTAANYLCAGRDRIDDVRAELRRYNPSDAYVDAVLAKAAAYASPTADIPSGSAASASGDAVVAVAMRVLGTPYVWGGNTPADGFDCSGLVQWAYAQTGVALPRTTGEQLHVGVAVTDGQLRPGDLVFSRGGIPTHDFGHVAIYAGGGNVIVAPHTGDVVALRPLPRVQAVRRVLTGS
jgi:cell wall-associated NlpC family hydrolase